MNAWHVTEATDTKNTVAWDFADLYTPIWNPRFYIFSSSNGDLINGFHYSYTELIPATEIISPLFRWLPCHHIYGPYGEVDQLALRLPRCTCLWPLAKAKFEGRSPRSLGRSHFAPVSRRSFLEVAGVGSHQSEWVEEFDSLVSNRVLRCHEIWHKLNFISWVRWPQKRGEKKDVQILCETERSYTSAIPYTPYCPLSHNIQ